MPLHRFVIQLLEDLVFFVSDVPNNGQNVLDIVVTKPNRERQKLMREQNILKQVSGPGAPLGSHGVSCRWPGLWTSLWRWSCSPACASGLLQALPATQPVSSHMWWGRQHLPSLRLGRSLGS